MRTGFLILVSFALLSFKIEVDPNWVEPKNVDFDRLEQLVLKHINERRAERGYVKVELDEKWDKVADASFERMRRYKTPSFKQSVKKRLTRYVAKKRLEVGTQQKWSQVGYCQVPSMKISVGSTYFYDPTRNTKYPFFYGYKSKYRQRDGVKVKDPNVVRGKTYEELAKEIVRHLFTSSKAEITKRGVSKIGIKIDYYKLKEKRVPEIKAIVVVGCNTIETIK